VRIFRNDSILFIFWVIVFGSTFVVLEIGKAIGLPLHEAQDIAGWHMIRTLGVFALVTLLGMSLSAINAWRYHA